MLPDLLLGLAALIAAGAVGAALLRRQPALPAPREPQHQHLWGEAAYDYTALRALAQPERDSMLAAGLGQTVERADLGFTTVSKRCTICGEVTSDIHLGRVSAT